MNKILVLGGGLVGKVIAADLAADRKIKVSLSDIATEHLKIFAKVNNLALIRTDFRDYKVLKSLAGNFDLIVSAVPGFMGYEVLSNLIETAKPIVDIAFMPENQLYLDKLAKKKRIPVIVDCGVSPGLSNLAIGLASLYFDDFIEGRICVGGLPLRRELPYQYRIVFSAADVIEEYVRPARMINDGKVIIKDALSEVEIIDFPEIGSLEGFNSDGLRTLLFTVKLRNLVEKTLRFPGHADLMKTLRYTGFFDTEPIDIDGKKIAPRDLSKRLLQKVWKMPEDEGDFCLLDVESKGIRKKKHERMRFFLLDYHDRKTGYTAMARTTGFPASITARYILKNKIKETGILPLELMAKDKAYVSYLLDELSRRGVNLKQEIDTL
ncbi:MAG: saccharopine dehydrogenase NADP-binding domain-containing protein [Candidatus Coatesbacteria bacterium]|nr:saccharopine dehydrogenase NADP-binding domain-containing protein [Candidatus Coatesbacteria bacterium]